MKCVLLKNGTVCGVDLSPTQKYCRNCGGNVVIEEVKTKECPKCDKRLISTDNFCTECRFSFEGVKKKIICEGQQEDGTICNHELSPSDIICSTCDIKLRKEDVLDRGNDQNQTEEINADQTEEINKDHTEEKHKDHTEEKNKGQTEEKNKDQTDKLVGRDDENRPGQETEKQIIGKIENKTQKPIFYKPSAEDGESGKRGLAVVCSHSQFMDKIPKLNDRDSASIDNDMMKSLWDVYGCHVIDFIDEEGDFYEAKLITKIENELQNIKNIELFVFVLSSHGTETNEDILHLDDQKAFQHYFFAKDRQCNTQDLMNKIANIKKLENKLKIFVIQACRSRTMGPKDKNEDHGVEIEIELDKDSDLSGEKNEGTVHPDAKGCMPPGDEKNKPDDKRQDDGIDQSDARGAYIPPEDEDEEVIQQPNESMIDLPPIEGVPHCDDCVVMFASMSGKYAYSRCNSQDSGGGWLIKAVDTILKKYEKGQQAHILDILVEINREVGTRESVVKRDTCEIPNLNLEIMMDNLHLGLKNHVNELRKIYSKYSSRVEISNCQNELINLATEIDQDGHTEVSLKRIKEKTVHLTKKFKEELQYVRLKSQSSFFHNLAFDDEDLFLCKIK